MTQWYVVHTQIHAEEKASWHLQNQRFTVYLPRYLKRRQHARRTEFVPAPLFPRYLFVEMDLAAVRWRAVRSTVGVVDLVCQGERPAPVPRSVIDQIRAREDARGLVMLPRAPGMDRGDTITISDGAFKGMCGILECVSDEDRVIVLLDLLGRQLRLTLPTEAIQAVA